MNQQDMSDLMDLLLTHTARELPAKALAEVFDRLIWCLDDEGSAILRVREAWLRSDDRRRVEVALAMDETYPFVDALEMDEVLSRVAVRWPDLSTLCRAIQAGRQRAESSV